MSSHEITLDSPKLGKVRIQAGYDATESEAYLTYETDDDRNYMSPSGLTVDGLQPLAQEKLGAQLPQDMINLIHNDMADVRMGVDDVNRRVFRYTPAGHLIVGLTI